MKFNGVDYSKLMFNGVNYLKLMFNGVNYLGGITYTNIIINGDFSNGTNGCIFNGSTGLVNNNILYITGDGSYLFNYTYFQTETTLDITRKYYFRVTINVTNSVCTDLYLLADCSGHQSGIDIERIDNPIQNQWYTKSGIIQYTNQTGYVLATALQVYADATTENGKTMEIKQVMVIDLTDKFGVGNEPTQAWCDANINL